MAEFMLPDMSWARCYLTASKMRLISAGMLLHFRVLACSVVGLLLSCLGYKSVSVLFMTGAAELATCHFSQRLVYSQSSAAVMMQHDCCYCSQALLYGPMLPQHALLLAADDLLACKCGREGVFRGLCVMTVLLLTRQPSSTSTAACTR